MSELPASNPRPDFLFLVSAPAGGESRMTVENGFGRPQFSVNGTASYLSYMPDLRNRGRDLWLANRREAFELSLPRGPGEVKRA